MADIGCGMALLDFQLMGNVRSITAIDTDGDALAEVEKRIDEELSANHNDAGKITTLMKDAAELGDERWDVVMMSFFASSAEMAGRMLALADHRSVIIMHGNERGGIFDPIRTDSPRMSVQAMEDYLTGNGYGYRKSVVDLQFGQPFRSIGAIHEFISDKAQSGHGAEYIAEGIEVGGDEADTERLKYSLEERIIKTNRYDYPYNLPRKMRTAVFIEATER
jgi:hypothetical protein